MMSGDVTLLSALSSWEEKNIGSSLSSRLLVSFTSFVKLQTNSDSNFSPTQMDQ